MSDATASQSAQQQLRDFVDSTRRLLEPIALTGQAEGGPRCIPETLRPSLRAAWPEARTDLQALATAALTATDAQLDSHGLRGPQLQFKLAVIQRFWERFLANKLLKWLGRLLEAIDNLLESLAEALGVGKMAIEIKKAIEQLIEHVDDDLAELEKA